MHRTFFTFGLTVALTAAFGVRADAAPPDFNADVAPILMKYCAGCHDEREANGQLLLTSFENISKGGANGPVFTARDANESRMIELIEGRAEPLMPPEDNQRPTAKEVAVIKAWINDGAKKPTAPLIRKPTGIPKIEPNGTVREPVTAVAHSADGRWMAVARYGSVDVYALPDQKPAVQLTGMTGNVNDVGFSRDGTRLFAAAGEAGFYGELSLYNTSDWSLVRRIEGQRDSLYAAAISPDDRELATGSYDQSIVLWNAETGEKLRELTGHNGPIFDLAYHPTLPILVSASGDRTVKLWDVKTGDRLDTLTEPEKEQYTVVVSPDGRFIAAGGVDRRIRIWEMTKEGQENTNPIRYSRFAHEKPILRLAFSTDGAILVSGAEDRDLKFWETVGFTQTGLITKQPDWPSALSFSADDAQLVVGRMDGSITTYPVKPEYRNSANLAEPVFLVRAPAPPEEAPAAQMYEFNEKEPNNEPVEANEIQIPATIQGVLVPLPGEAEDADRFSFEAKKGESWVIETNAERQKSPADTFLEVFDAKGNPVLRYQLQAVRDSYINFRGLNSTELQVRVKNWEEMGLNQYLYMNGEVCRVTRMPLGPDSGLKLYDVGGKRRAYFDTTAVAHANEEPCYIVEAFPPDATLIDNGLPVFPLYYANDDDGRRKSGKDSRLMFTAPEDGEYQVRVKDTRGFAGDDFKYTLTIRRPEPGFEVSVGGKGTTVKPGSSAKLTFTADRKDDFEGEITIDVTGLPEGYSCSTPVTIQDGHNDAEAVLSLAADAPPATKEDWDKVRVTARAKIYGQEVEKQLGSLGEIKAGGKPFAILHLTLLDGSDGELRIRPGGRVRAKLTLERFEGFEGEMKCVVDNLPHGVIVDNIGLNGVMIRAGETEREIFLSAYDWVPATQRPIFAGATGSHSVTVKDEKTGKDKKENKSVAPFSRSLTLRVERSEVAEK